jgi:hypothetical protein
VEDATMLKMLEAFAISLLVSYKVSDALDGDNEDFNMVE